MGREGRGERSARDKVLDVGFVPLAAIAGTNDHATIQLQTNIRFWQQSRHQSESAIRR